MSGLPVTRWAMLSPSFIDFEEHGTRCHVVLTVCILLAKDNSFFNYIETANEEASRKYPFPPDSIDAND